LKVYRQPSLNYHDDVNGVTPGTTLLGYFQSWRYFEGVADRLALALTSAPLSDAEAKVLDSLEDTACITAHVRRGDYLTPQAAMHHGIASADYFTRAFSLLRTLSAPTVTVRGFSDSPDVVRREMAAVPDFELVDDPASLGPLATVRARSGAVAFEMCNSSVSWWAAWLLSRRDPAAPVVAPRPWQADGQSGHDQLLPNWITLDAR
jgi:hypothetical protein